MILITHSGAPSCGCAPFDDLCANAGGALNLLKAVRHSFFDARFVLILADKTYRDTPNECALQGL